MNITTNTLAALDIDLGFKGDRAATRLVCAMSGGVDSTVAAALVKAMGFDVIGITLQLYDHGIAMARKGACCAGQDIHDARRAAAQLNIPHYVLNFENRFREAVIDQFAESYLAGQTPIPCVTCNQTVKFADLLDRAKQLGAQALVTGHYIESRARSKTTPHRDLFTPTDMGRDQSYFLFATTQDQIDFLRFPLGLLTKAETRAIAAQLDLNVANKPDSQDICFVPQGRYSDLVIKLRPDAEDPGDIVHIDGQIIGRHDGIVHYTIGQRKGLGDGSGLLRNHDGTGSSTPLYVIAIDPEQKKITVGPRSALKRYEICLRDVNWLAPLALSNTPLPLYVKIRSSRPATAATIHRNDSGVIVTIPDGEEAITPGQACVFYEKAGSGARVFGGGFIARSV